MTNLPPKETRFTYLNGIVSINLNDKQNFNDLGAELTGYNTERFEAVALRVFIENTPLVTVYAIDKFKQVKPDFKGKLPVHKFKKEMSFDELFYKLKNVNFTVTTGEYDIEDMEVVNK